MDDHEVLLSTSWALNQNYSTDLGEQAFDLSFTGQGWQERVGDTLSSWELGNGTFRTLETTEDGTTELDLVLTQLWKNETIVAGLLTSQVFDARGFGGLQTTVVDGDMVTVIHADVSDALLNRSVIDGVVGEHLSIEATGMLNVSEDSGENDFSIDGELAVFLFEYIDVDGVRVLQHTQFEAMADFVLVEDGSRLDVSLDGFSSLARWEDGVRTQHLEELYGAGTFGFADEEDNASLQVNGTILDLHTKLENGTTLIDDLHVDGTLSGDARGRLASCEPLRTPACKPTQRATSFWSTWSSKSRGSTSRASTEGTSSTVQALVQPTTRRGTIRRFNPIGTTERSALFGGKRAPMLQRVKNSQSEAPCSKMRRHR